MQRSEVKPTAAEANWKAPQEEEEEEEAKTWRWYRRFGWMLVSGKHATAYYRAYSNASI